MMPSYTNATAASGWVAADHSRPVTAAERTAGSEVNAAGATSASAAVSTPSPTPAISPSTSVRWAACSAASRSPRPTAALTKTCAGTARASVDSESRPQSRYATCWPASGTGPSRAATPVAASGTTPSAIVRTDSRCPSRSRAATSLPPGRRGGYDERLEAYPYAAAASTWAATVPQADPISPVRSPNTSQTSSATFTTLAPTAIRSGVLVSSSPVRWPLPA